MCECRDCDNFKAKKVDAKIGDRVETPFCCEGIVVADNSRRCYVDGSKIKGKYLVFLDVEYDGLRTYNFTAEELT